MEENHPEDVCSETDATDLTERCELIGDRLIALEDKLQTAILNQDQALTHILPEVKCTLHSMLTQLKIDEQEEEEARVLDELIKDEAQVKVEAQEEDEEEEEEEEEEEDDQYFSDSWDI
ncbi:hypothetical protein XENORESO_010826 [Xenotaenia resolanae]|uniref:Uncharacterized protein n=1 Tax=Xenotaenia resolanae TaxID=208358 RepID=A0ABV0X4J6_9TELE